MAFWVTFLFWLGSQIVSALLAKPARENARPSGLDEFQVPTATEGRVVPVIVGKVKMGGTNVVWYGDLATEAIEERVGGFLGIGGSDITKGYRYNLGVQMALCRGPIGGHDRIWFADKVIKSGESAGDVVIADEEFFGGEDRGGGIDFTLEFFNGATGQAVSSYLAQFQTPTPRYQNTAYFLLNDGGSGPGYIGNSASLRDFAFELFWYPNALAVTGGKERIGDDANPICFLYELLVQNDDWGIQIAGSDVLVTGTAAQGALRTIAEQVADEGLGFSAVFDREIEVVEVVQEIERHVDGAFRLDLTDGKFKIVLARPPTTTPPTLDESNIEELLNFSRGTWAETINELRVSYTDRGKDYDPTYARDHDLANREITGRRAVSTLSYPYVRTREVAQKIAARELPTVSLPLMRMSARLDRSQYTLQRGDPFLWTWPDEEIELLPMRITRVRYGKDTKAPITIDAVEDGFRLETTGFSSPPDSGFTPPAFAPADVLSARIWEPPAPLSPGSGKVVVLAARNGGLQLSFDIYADLAGGTSYTIQTEEITTWTPRALLDGALSRDLGDVTPYTGSLTIDNLNDVTLAKLQAAASSTVDPDAPRNLVLVDDELMFFEGVTDNGDGSFDLTTLHRGVLGTIPADHANDAEVWFPGFGGGALTALSATSIRVKIVTKTATGELALGSASPIPAAGNYAVKGAFPYAPRDLRLGTSDKFVDDDGWTEQPGTLRFTWKGWSPASSLDTKQGDANKATDGLTSYRVEVRRVDDDSLVVNRSGIPLGSDGGAYTAQGFIPTTAAAWPAESPVPAELDFYAQVYARTQGVDSPAFQSVDFSVIGYGIDYGESYGGLDDAGTVLAQGDAPFIPEPIPGVDELREVRFTFAGTPTAQDDYEANVVFFGPDGVFNKTYTVQSEASDTPEDLAADLFDEFVSETDALFAPFVDVSLVGATVTLSSSFGSLRGSAENPAGDTKATLLQEAKGTTTARRQAAFLDFFDTEINAQGLEEDVLAPSAGDEYDAQTSYSFTVVGLTHEARVALNFVDNGKPIASRDFGIYTFGPLLIPPEPQGALNNLRKLDEQVESSGLSLLDYVSVSIGRNSDSPTADNGNNVAMERQGLTVLAEPEFAIAVTGPNAASKTSNSGTGYALLAKQIQTPLVGRALAQVVEVGAFKGDDTLQAGQEFTLTLDGTEISYEITGGDVTLEGSSSLYRDVVLEYWEANLPAGFTGTLIQGTRATPRSDGRAFYYSALYIQRTSAGTSFTYSAQASYGARLTVENL